MRAAFTIETSGRYSSVHTTLERNGEPLVFYSLEELYGAMVVLEAAEVDPRAKVVIPEPDKVPQEVTVPEEANTLQSTEELAL